MRIALITGGQPRFTPDFIRLMSQLKGFDSADLYFNFWTSDWASSEEEGRKKVEAILPPNYRLAKLKIVDQPQHCLPLHELYHPPAQPENINWWYARRFGQAMSLSMAFDLIDQDYDLVVRFRLDGVLDREIDLSKLDFTNTDLIFPADPKAGFDDYKINDQFAIGTQAGMKFYCGIGKEFEKYVLLSDPEWECNGHGTWSLEHLMGTYMKAHNRTQTLGNFNHYINTQGRSRYTDKHYHHGIVPDPTAQ